MATQIDKFEITSYGEVKIRVNRPNGASNIEYQFYNVPKSIIVKFISQNKAPSLQDFEGWLQDYRNKKAKEMDQDSVISCSSFNFWSADE